MRPHRSILLIVPVTAAALLLLAGCVPDGGTATPTSTPSPSTSSTPAPTPTSTPIASGTPITISCDQLITGQAMLDYNPNYTLKADYTPAPGSLGAQALDADGIACAWVHGSNGSLIEVSAADLPDEQLNAIMNELVTSSNPVPTYGVEGYFRADAGVGVAQVASGSYWITASSVAFFEPGDVTPLMEAAIASLG
ncbi:hypothetical protein BH10ACT7_BH10ACT7_24790 [soil metagenome]